MQLDSLLQITESLGASDLHLSTNLPPTCRVDGRLKNIQDDVITEELMNRFVQEIVPQNLKEHFAAYGDADFSYEISNGTRFRMNVYHQRGTKSLAARVIPNKVPKLEELNMPGVLLDLAKKPHGLVLVTGPTGSGKSTTLASMIDYINNHHNRHIITLEDPIEYEHESKKSLINQREIGIDAKNFLTGLRASLRQDPDVILLGEMRDLETISTALTAAETGHLVFATLHTSSAKTTIDRIIDIFPAEQQRQIRIQVANVLQGIVSQRLFPKAGDKGRIAATEILVRTPAIVNLIRNEKVDQIQNMIMTGRKEGMHTLSMSIRDLLQKKLVDYDTVSAYLVEGEY